MEIILIRHAQPAWVRDGKSILDPQLTDQGRDQARQLADAARNWSEPTEIFVSPTLRSRQTAAPLLETFGRPEATLPWLEELRLPSSWDGAPAEEVGRELRQGRSRPEEDWWDGLPGGESYRDFHDRVTKGLDAFLADRGLSRPEPDALHLYSPPAEHARPHRILLVAHAGTNAVVINHLLGLPPVPWAWERFGMQHTAVTRVGTRGLLGGRVFSLRVFSDVSHLPKDLWSR